MHNDQLIIKYICDAFNRTYNVNYSIEYFDSIEFEKRYKKTVPSNVNALSLVGSNKNIVWIDQEVIELIRKLEINQGKDYDMGTTYLMFTCYHELAHKLEFYNQEKLINFEPWLFEMERIILNKNKENHIYRNNHEKFMFEIDADIFSVEQMKKNGLNIPINKKFLELYEQYNRIRKNEYDYCYFTNLFVEIIRNHPEIIYYYENRKNIMHSFEFDGYIKSIKDLYKEQNEITPFICATGQILNKLYYDINHNSFNYSVEELTFLYESLLYVKNIHDEKRKTIALQNEAPSQLLKEIRSYVYVKKGKSNQKFILEKDKVINYEEFEKHYSNIDMMIEYIESYMGSHRTRIYKNN